MRKNNLSFSGKKAIVTGATRGIGKSIADQLSRLGCEVYSTGTSDSNKESNNFKLDLADDKNINEFVKKMHTIDGGIHILVNNAGINIVEPINELNIDNFKLIQKVNLTGCAVLMKEASKIMIKNNIEGKILNISSIFGIVSKEKRDSYSASKTGLIGLTRAASIDLAPSSILVNALCPGFTKTDLTSSILSESDMKKLLQDVPMGRFAEPEEIAKAAVFLCSDMNTYMTGQTLIIDGGFTII